MATGNRGDIESYGVDVPDYYHDTFVALLLCGSQYLRGSLWPVRIEVLRLDCVSNLHINFIDLLTLNLFSMSKKLLTAVSFFIPSLLFSQLKFQDISFEEAVNKAKKTGQLIFMQVESVGCTQCNEVADKAFEDQDLGAQLEETFICLKITPDHPDKKTIDELYNMQKSFGSLFINNDKTLIHKYSRSTTRVAAYKEQIEIALQKAGEDLRISELETEYKKGNKSPGIIEALLLKRKILNLQTDSLLDEYVSLLPADSLSSARTLLFIAQMAPVIDSKVDQVLRKDRILFNKAWYTMETPLRVSINNRIIYKSMQKAIREKNETFAYRVANFSRATNSNPQSGAKAFSKNMLSYYKETNDIKNYLGHAVSYYDDYYMTVDPDSVKAKDSMNLKKLFAQKTNVTTVKRNDTTFTRKEVAYSPLAQFFTQDLNNGARSLYTMTSDSFYLQKALKWAKRANEFAMNPEAMDTYARLLYKTNNRPEAIEWMNKVIEWGKKIGLPTQEYETILSKMKTNSNKIDIY